MLRQALATALETALDFLRRYVRHGADGWRDEALPSHARAQLAKFPLVQAEYVVGDAPRTTDTMLNALEDAVLAAIDALPSAQRGAALAYFGITPNSRGKAKGERERLAAGYLRRGERWFRTPSPKYGGDAPRDHLVRLVAEQLIEGADPMQRDDVALTGTPDTRPASLLAGRSPAAAPADVARRFAEPDTRADADRSLSWDTFYDAVAQLGRRLFADKAYGGFRPDAVVAVNHGGAVVAGLLYYGYSRNFQMFSVAARVDDYVSRPEHLAALVELANRHERALRVLLVDDSMKSGDSLRLARSVIEAALDGHDAVVRMAVLVYRRDYHERSGNESAPPDEFIHTDIDHFPYGPV
jgi:hypoxanthine phosphoribosyltransferase